MRVLAIRSGALGDTIVALPAIAALSRFAARVEVVGTAPYVELLSGHALAAETHSIDRKLFGALFHETSDESELLAFVSRFDLVVAWSTLPLLAEKTERLGVELIEATPLPSAGVHASDHLFSALEPLGIRAPAPFPRLDAIAGDPKASLPVSYVALHPSSGSPAKNWAPEHFEAVARLARAAGFPLVWVEGEADAPIVQSLVKKVPGRVARNRPLPELAALLGDSAAYIGNDSGVSHLAAAVGAPTVAVFRSTDPAQWAPRGPRVHVADGGASPEAVWGFAVNLMKPR